MRCNACYNDNVNEATYCKACGRNISETYIGSQKGQLIQTILVFCILALLVASVIICAVNVSEILNSSPDASSFSGASVVCDMQYNAKTNKTLFVSYDAQSKTKTVLKKKGEYVICAKNGSVIICQKGSKTYRFASGELLELKNCISYKIGETGTGCAFVDSSNSLYHIINNRIDKQLAVDALDYCISEDGNCVAFCIINSGNRAIYLGTGASSEFCCTDFEHPFSGFTGVSSKKTIYYVDSENNALIIVPCTQENKNKSDNAKSPKKSDGENGPSSSGETQTTAVKDGYKRYLIKNFSYAVDITENSVLLVKTNNQTYSCQIDEKAALEEKRLLNTPVSGILLPDNRNYNGDYSDCLFYSDKNSDLIQDYVLKPEEGGDYNIICNNFKAVKVSFDLKTVYYINQNDSLYAVDVYNNTEPVLVSGNVIDFAISAASADMCYLTDIQTVWAFDGRVSKKLIGGYPYIELSSDKNGAVVIAVGDSLAFYDIFTYANSTLKHSLVLINENDAAYSDMTKELSRFNVAEYYGSLADMTYCLNKADEFLLLNKDGLFVDPQKEASESDAAISDSTKTEAGKEQQ